MDEDWAAPILKDDCLFSSTLSSAGFAFSSDDDLSATFGGSREIDLHSMGFSGSHALMLGDYPDTIDIKSEPNDDCHVEYHNSEQSSPCSSLSNGAEASMLTAIDGGGGNIRVSPRPPRILLSSQALPPVSHFSQIARSVQPAAMFYDDDLSPSPASSERSSPMDQPSIPSCFAARARSKMHEMAVKQRLITDQDPRGNGFVQLSPEEKRTLVQEGYALPTRLPLSKSEEEALKIVRRKIKNKLSAQESRRKRKEYMDTLEQRVQAYYTENTQLRSRIKQLEAANRALQTTTNKRGGTIEMPSVGNWTVMS